MRTPNRYSQTSYITAKKLLTSRNQMDSFRGEPFLITKIRPCSRTNAEYPWLRLGPVPSTIGLNLQHQVFPNLQISSNIKVQFLSQKLQNLDNIHPPVVNDFVINLNPNGKIVPFMISTDQKLQKINLNQIIISHLKQILIKTLSGLTVRSPASTDISMFSGADFTQTPLECPFSR